MYAPQQQLKPLSAITLSADESKMLSWIRSAAWEPQAGREPIPYKAKVPEFYGGVRLYKMQGGGGGSMGPLDLFIKKLEHQGVLGKQELYPVSTQGASRFLSLKKGELDNLGVGEDDNEDE